MPVLKNAIKKLKQDKKRSKHNRRLKTIFKELVKTARVKKSKDAVSKAFSAVDKAAKHNIIHNNKAARLKASISKLISEPKKPAKK